MLGKRPLSFFGPECGDPENWQNVRSRIVASQLDWDARFSGLPWYKQWLCHLLGEVTEPVNTSEGMPIDVLVNECMKYKHSRNYENY